MILNGNRKKPSGKLALTQIEQKVIEETILEAQASGPKDMGRVMKEVMSKIAGRADGKLVSDLVKERLTKVA